MASSFRSLIGSKCLKTLEKSYGQRVQLRQLVPHMRLRQIDSAFNPLRISLPSESLPDHSPAFLSSFIQDFEVDEWIPSAAQEPEGTNILFSVDQAKFFSMELLNQLCNDSVPPKWINDDLFPENQELNVLVEFRYDSW
jgi:hypothetical protein